MGEAHTLVLDREGDVYSFGWSELGQLGIKELYGVNQFDFKIHKVPLKESCCQIGAGSNSSYALTQKSNKMYVWGSNQYGQLGLGRFTDDEDE